MSFEQSSTDRQRDQRRTHKWPVEESKIKFSPSVYNSNPYNCMIDVPLAFVVEVDTTAVSHQLDCHKNSSRNGSDGVDDFCQSRLVAVKVLLVDFDNCFLVERSLVIPHMALSFLVFVFVILSGIDTGELNVFHGNRWPSTRAATVGDVAIDQMLFRDVHSHTSNSCDSCLDNSSCAESLDEKGIN